MTPNTPMTELPVDLEPCPFCGAELIQNGELVVFWKHPMRSLEEARCPGARVSMEASPEPDIDLFAAWNRRASQSLRAPAGEAVQLRRDTFMAGAEMTETVDKGAEDFTNYAYAAEDGWQEWNGGACPVELDVRVDFRDRGRQNGYFTAPAGTINWTHWGSSGDIVAYRIALHQPDTRIEGGGEYVEVGTFIASSEHGVGVSWGDLGPLGTGDKLYARAAPSSPTVGELEVVAWECTRRTDHGPETTLSAHPITDGDRSLGWRDEPLVTLASATTRIQRAEREIASLTKWKDELLRVEKVQREARFAAESQLADAVKVLKGMVRLSEMGLEESLKETEESGNFAAFERARAFLSTIGEKPDAE